ncbi:uncharacterized protein LOC111264136 isoform X2 [Varroa jacobsoni]|uniref:uncharacterized protein LOC111264136 isoform X2 n=1 Tax=Varroa jacobsoni TaxID=62625 RepID=UPI000BF3D724|nr:uncharacterized protein LOC111264136 isoform X2 [Varroa jacobsoni]
MACKRSVLLEIFFILTKVLLGSRRFKSAFGRHLDRVPYFEWAYNGWRILQRNQNEHVNSDVHVLGRPAHHIDVRRLKADPLLVDGLTTREATYVRIRRVVKCGGKIEPSC